MLVHVLMGVTGPIPTCERGPGAAQHSQESQQGEEASSCFLSGAPSCFTGQDGPIKWPRELLSTYNVPGPAPGVRDTAMNKEIHVLGEMHKIQLSSATRTL